MSARGPGLNLRAEGVPPQSLPAALRDLASQPGASFAEGVVSLMLDGMSECLVRMAEGGKGVVFDLPLALVPMQEPSWFLRQALHLNLTMGVPAGFHLYLDDEGSVLCLRAERRRDDIHLGWLNEEIATLRGLLQLCLDALTPAPGEPNVAALPAEWHA